MNAQDLAYSQQKNREYIWNQSKQERKVFKVDHNDNSIWNDSDEAWTDYRYMQLCEYANITPW